MFQGEIRGGNDLAAGQGERNPQYQQECELAKREPTLREHLAGVEAKAHQRLADVEKVRVCFRTDLDQPMSKVQGTLGVLLGWA